MSEDKRVVFYSANDISSWWNLEKAEMLLDSIDLDNEFLLIDYLEFYNIHKYFDNKVLLKKWSNDDIIKYEKIIKELFLKISIFIKNIKEEDISWFLNLIKDNYYYQKDFWELIDKFKVYNKISNLIFSDILKSYPNHIDFILKYKNLVKNFSQEIKDFLLNYDWSWEILLDYVKSKDKKIFFPESLNDLEKEKIIDIYLDKDTEQFGNLDFIYKMWDWFLKLSPKIKLKAKKLYEKKNASFFKNNNNVLKFWYQVWLSEEQIESLKINKNNEWLPSITYSVDFLNKFNFQLKPLSIFINLFWFLNEKLLIDLISKDSEISTIEWLFSHWSNSDYKTSHKFTNDEILSLLNLQIFQTYLKNFKNISIEDIINIYVNEILLKNKWLEELQFKINNYDIPYQERITNLIPKVDFFIKQYRCYIEESNIDFDLIKIDSKPISYELIPSLLPKKYFYELNNKLGSLKYIFYSDQSGLFYIEWFENKYKDFYNLLLNENLELKNFHNYQQEQIKLLIKENYLYLDENSYIKIKDPLFIFIIWELYREWVIFYYFYEDNIKDKIKEMEENMLLFSESLLLSKQESDYFNYYLNKSKFLNWPEIRNKNIHWYKYSSDSEAYTDYLTLIKIIILLLLKIDIELNIKNNLDKNTWIKN